MNTYNSFNDIVRFIGDQPLCCASLYADNYDIPVSHAYLNLLKSKGFVYGEKIPEVSDEEFWEFFKCGEVEPDFRR